MPKGKIEEEEEVKVQHQPIRLEEKDTLLGSEMSSTGEGTPGEK